MSRDAQWSVGIQDATTHLMLKFGMQIISVSPKFAWQLMHEIFAKT
jgi:hypothetical protein